MVVCTHDGAVEFRFYRPGAASVCVVGDFNGWRQGAEPMKREGAGQWICRLRLPTGVYRFKYLADEQWYPDYAAFGIESGPFGFNSVLVVDGHEAARHGAA